MSFENITKGEFSTDNIDVLINDNIFCQCYDGDNTGILEMNYDLARSNAEFVSYCFNLQQKLDIGCFEEAVNSLEQYADFLNDVKVGINCWSDLDEKTKSIKQLLNKVNKNKQ